MLQTVIVSMKNKSTYRKEIYQSYYSYSYLPTPPLGQDITQGQFLSGV